MAVVLWILLAAFALFALYCFLVAPNVLRRKFVCPGLTSCAYAHRGLYRNGGDAPENSLPAFLRAVRAGYGIELDVRETRDHALVIHHDETLERSCGDQRRVCDVPLGELQKFSLFGTQEHIPTLDEALAAVDGQAPLLVELKTDFYNRSLAEAVYARLSQYAGVYSVESFDPFAMRWFRKNAPDVVRGQLAFMPPLKGRSFTDALRRLALGLLLVDFISRPDFIAYGHETDKNLSCRFVFQVFRPYLAAWTVRDKKKYQELRPKYDVQIFERFRP